MGRSPSAPDPLGGAETTVWRSRGSLPTHLPLTGTDERWKGSVAGRDTRKAPPHSCTDTSAPFLGATDIGRSLPASGGACERPRSGLEHGLGRNLHTRRSNSRQTIRGSDTQTTPRPRGQAMHAPLPEEASSEVNSPWMRLPRNRSFLPAPVSLCFSNQVSRFARFRI